MINIPHLYSHSNLSEIVIVVKAVEDAGIDVSGVNDASVMLELPSSLYCSHASNACSLLMSPGSQLSKGYSVKIGKILEKPNAYCKKCVAAAVMREVGRPLHELVTLARTLVSVQSLDATCSVRTLADAAQNLAHQLTWSSLGDEDTDGVRLRAVESTACAYKKLASSLERFATYRNLYASYVSAPAPAIDLSDLVASPTRVLDETFKAFCTAGYDGADARAAAIRKAELMSRFGVTRTTVAVRLEPVLSLWERLHEDLLAVSEARRTVLFREAWAGLPFHDVPRAIASSGMAYEGRSFFHVSAAEAALLLSEDHYVTAMGQVDAHLADVVCSLARTLHVEGLALDDIFASHKTAFEAALLASAEPKGVTSMVISGASV
jgi:hypothetical protein